MKYYVKIPFSILVLAITLTFCVSAYGSVYTSGPSGGYGGKTFSIWPALPRDKMKIIEIRIRAGSLIDSIQVVYKYDNGVTVIEGPFGGSGGRQYIFKLDDDEYIISMHGRCDNLIHSIKFVTNKKESRTYGGNGGTRFFRYRPPENTEIAGFFGRSGVYLDAIGAYYRVVDQSKPVANYDVNEHAGFSGGTGGNYFAITSPYDIHTTYEDCTISEISIWADAFVNGIEVSYRNYKDEANRVLPPVFYGNMSGFKRTFLLDSNEYITAISGKYGAVIDSIMFETNKRTSPKYGGKGGVQWYRYEAPKESRINGFLGYSGIHIDSIGVVTSSIFPCGDCVMNTIIYTPRGTAVHAQLSPEHPQNELVDFDQKIEDTIKEHGWKAHIISRSTATYNCHGYAWHGNKRGERVNMDDANEIAKYWKDGSYLEIAEGEANWGDIIYYPEGGGVFNHSAVVTNKTDQGLWCISKWGVGPLVGHLFSDCPNYVGQKLRFYRKKY